ncbi:IS3 family transposase [Glaciimonas sp. Gout2]|uniref:IS3 family transposase n=1 Tax=Glaciimonas sp. Cout2 TaxID=3048621 RepID=UPI002B222CAF|nr:MULTISPECIES: IS3 family transposase [unclassified Glaciimonas]MEB0013084.1 IS3 family transposase [Glaciimonas sp. Cout2]MEB0082033.1 IS3 family transposase [Glaciimonas sp. Gout2]
MPLLEQGLSGREAAMRLGMSQSNLNKWVVLTMGNKSGKMMTVAGSRSVAELEEELAKMRRELHETRQERDILKKANGVLCTGVATRYAHVKTLQLHYPVKLLCKVLVVSRSGFYDWLTRVPSERSCEDERLKIAIKVAHRRTRETYSVRRLQPELANDGFTVGRDRLTRLRRQLGIVCKQKRQFKVTTNSNHSFPVADNLLNQTFNLTQPNQVWVTNITYIPTQEGWLYLAGIKDVFTCEIVGYAMGDRMTQTLTSRALWRAVALQRPSAGLIHHSDRGSQYCAHAYRLLLEQFDMQASMSRKGNCYDNAPMESCWGSLKNELVHHRRYATRAEAEASIGEYIEIFYNRQRRHSRLGYLSPAAFADNFNRQKKSA